MNSIKLISVLIVLLSSCINRNSSINTINFTLVDSYCFEDTKTNSNLFYIDSSRYISFDEDKSCLFISKIDTLIKIQLSTDTNENILKAEVIFFDNLDKYFYLFFKPITKKNGLYDLSGALVKFNYQGDVIEKYNFENTLFHPDQQEGLSKEEQVFLHPFYGFVFRKNKLFFTHQRYIGKVGDIGFSKASSLGGIWDINTKEFVNIKAQYPLVNEGKDMYPVLDNRFSCILSDTKVIFWFRYTNRIVSYDINSGKIDESRTKFLLMKDSLPPLSYREDSRSIPNKNLAVGGFNSMIFDPFRKLYWRIAYLPPLDSNNMYQRNNRIRCIAIYDTLFNHLGEFIVPKSFKYSFPASFSSKGAIFLDKENCISIYSYNFQKITLEELQKQYHDRILSDTLNNANKKEGIIGYLSDYHKINQDTIFALIIPLESSCAPCIKSIAQIFEYSNKYPFNKVYYLLIGKNNKKLSDFIKNFQIDLRNSYIKTDLDGGLLRYQEPWVNPMYIKIINGNVINKVILNPDLSHSILDIMRKDFK